MCFEVLKFFALRAFFTLDASLVRDKSNAWTKLVEKYALPKGIQEEKISSCAREKFLSLVYELQTSKRVNEVQAQQQNSISFGYWLCQMNAAKSAV